MSVSTGTAVSTCAKAVAEAAVATGPAAPTGEPAAVAAAAAGTAGAIGADGGVAALSAPTTRSVAEAGAARPPIATGPDGVTDAAVTTVAAGAAHVRREAAGTAAPAARSAVAAAPADSELGRASLPAVSTGTPPETRTAVASPPARGLTDAGPAGPAVSGGLFLGRGGAVAAWSAVAPAIRIERVGTWETRTTVLLRIPRRAAVAAPAVGIEKLVGKIPAVGRACPDGEVVDEVAALEERVALGRVLCCTGRGRAGDQRAEHQRGREDAA